MDTKVDAESERVHALDVVKTVISSTETRMSTKIDSSELSRLNKSISPLNTWKRNQILNAIELEGANVDGSLLFGDLGISTRLLGDLSLAMQGFRLWRGAYHPGLGREILLQGNEKKETSAKIAAENPWQWEASGFIKGVALDEIKNAWVKDNLSGFVNFGGQFLYLPKSKESKHKSELENTYILVDLSNATSSSDLKPEKRITVEMPDDEAWSLATASEVGNYGSILHPALLKARKPDYVSTVVYNSSALWADMGSVGLFVLGPLLALKIPSDPRLGEWIVIYRNRVEATCFWKDKLTTSLKVDWLLGPCSVIKKKSRKINPPEKLPLSRDPAIKFQL